jgi:phosphoglycolate phosphatase-like HAD superfamily hydrolase
VAAVSGLARQAILVRHPERFDSFGQQTQTSQMLELETVLRNGGKEIFVFDNAMLYLAAHQYAKHREGNVFMRFGNQGNLPGVVACLAQFYPAEFWKNDELEKHFHETVLIAPASETLNALRQAGYEATVCTADPLEVVYLNELAAYSDLQHIGTIVSVETHEEDHKTTQSVRSQFE